MTEASCACVNGVAAKHANVADAASDDKIGAILTCRYTRTTSQSMSAARLTRNTLGVTNRAPCDTRLDQFGYVPNHYCTRHSRPSCRSATDKSMPEPSQETVMQPTPFTIQIPDKTLADLH